MNLRTLDLSAAFLVEGLTSAELPEDVFLQPRAKSTRQLPIITLPPAGNFAFRAEPELPELGSVLGAYRLERAIGIGGFGAVYRARHVVLDTIVAIKLMRPSVARQRPALTRLLTEEARFAARLDHAHVVRVHDVAQNGGNPYIVMEYVDGPDLSVMIKRRGGLPPKMVIRIVRHITAALAAGLQERMIHRDVKPSNILLTAAGVTKLADFGLARSSSESAASGLRGVVGTTGYMSPEQLEHPALVDFRSDIYALGVTAYHALTNALPFPDRDQRQPSYRTQLVLPPNRIMNSIPAALSDLVVRMLSDRAEDRPSSYEQLAAELADLRR